ncbi:SpoVR family protein [Pseudomonas aeruginosa VRFPA09]|nr:SpoVR family protein [Pseudomonas aeruginosa YL84]EVT84165.1 SpoVR family protein [Pseudomonas aeruginosa VRFPA09]
MVRVRARARSLRRQLRPAADRLGIGHLPGVPRAVPEEARRMSKRQPIATGSEWTFELIQQYDREISRIAERYALDTYPNQIEVITAEQMMDAYASVGMPIGYNHWSYGKHFLSTEKNYKRGQMGLAYEIVINSDPCIAYLMEENTQCMQALVIAHACYGHNSFFKGNYLFRTWTDASSIIDYLVFAKQYIMQCEERYGIDAVEDLLDSCHALMNYGVDRYKRPYPISAEEERQRQKEREELIQRQVNDLWRTIPRVGGKDKEQSMARYPSEPQENILYFIEKNAPLLEPWQREVIRIVRKIAQYFYPQRQTQVMNEGWATFWHYTLLNDLYDEGLVNDGFMMEFLQYHTSVVYQPSFDSPYYSGINPYALGFAMYRDIRRICEEPTDEDRRWFPDIAGSDWLATLKFAMKSFKDESFILQFLSPKVIRDLKLFSILDDDQKDDLLVAAIHDEAGYRTIRETLAAQYNLGNREPNIQIWNVDRRGDRSLTLRHQQFDRQPLSDSTADVLKHLHRLWGFDIHLETLQGDQLVQTHHMPPKGASEGEEGYPRLDLIIPPI